MPRAKSVETLKLHGTFRKGRHADRPSRSAPLGRPSAWLDAIAKEWWSTHKAQLDANGVGAGDVSLVESAAKWFSLWRSALLDAEKTDAEYRTWCRLSMCWKAFAAAASKLGIGPAERSRIRGQGAKQSKLSEFVKNG